jgi:starch phosphorylase
VTTTTTDDLQQALTVALERELVRTPGEQTQGELYEALARTVMTRIAPRWLATQRSYAASQAREVCYLSMEFHLGRLLRSALLALELEEPTRVALDALGARLEDLEGEEPDPGLGSGGLGRLAACFLDSLATLDLPARGYGLRFDMGLFEQVIHEGRQVEEAHAWRGERGWPWELARPDEAVRVSFWGRVGYAEDNGRVHRVWVDAHDVLAVPYDVPVPGYGTDTVGTLRLWAARPAGPSVDFGAFQAGAYKTQHEARAITTFLYPADDTREGRLLRLQQQFLLVSATLQDLLRRHQKEHGSLDGLAERFAVQLNDTHPALGIPELMRLLVDVHEYEWEQAWEVTKALFAYTNHTLLPEALETWTADLIGELLPRHLQLIQEIDRRFQEEVRAAFPGEGERLRRMTIVEPGQPGRVHMAHLCVAGSHSVNGVAALHSELLRKGLLKDFCDLYPEKFNNKTNGITPRRWLRQANPELAALVTGRLGAGWERDLTQLAALSEVAEDADFQAAFNRVKAGNKARLVETIQELTGIEVDPDSMFDVQIKRFHEYKRQLLLLLWVVRRYLELTQDPSFTPPARTVLFAGKAAATYHAAKRVIELIHAVADVVNDDPAARGLLKIVFLPNYRVSLAEVIVPAADLSEQISTAGYEASGTGNMKLALNGALTIGTLDGANVEIREEVGEENIFIFGLEAHQVRELRDGGYDPRSYVDENEALRAVLDAIAGDTFCKDQPGRFESLVHEDLLAWDTYMLMADFQPYCDAQEQADARYRDRAAWTRAAILNTARAGKFSSDRTISDYAREIWKVEPRAVQG